MSVEIFPPSLINREEMGHPGRGFQLIASDTMQEMSRAAADGIADELRVKPGSLLCVATGSTPALTYQFLAARARKEPSLFHSVRILKLDEWGDLPMDDPGSCEAYLQTHLVQPMAIPTDRYISFQNKADPQTECQRITKVLEKSGSIDLSILGLGVNGHLGFNEPAEALQPMPHRADLAPSSLKHSMIQHSKIPLKYGLTIGMAHLLQSRMIFLLVSGAHKAQAMRQLFSKRITTNFPASFLWLHPRVYCFCDQAAIEGIDIHLPEE